MLNSDRGERDRTAVSVGTGSGLIFFNAVNFLERFGVYPVIIKTGKDNTCFGSL